MTETPEHFRDQLGRTVYNARLHLAGPWEARSPSTKDDYTNAALAVYTQALRDVREHLWQQAYTRESNGVVQSVMVGVNEFAAERGIDLNDKEVH